MSATPEFDAKLGAALRDAGIERASTPRKNLLALARHLCVTAAMSRPERTATADDAAKGFVELGLPADALGNAAGGLFKNGQWESVGFRHSERTSNHRHLNRLWRLVDEPLF